MRWILMIGAILALAVACADRPASRLRVAADAVGSAASRWLHPQVARATGSGTLTFTVYWPVRYRTATIPDTTQTLVVRTTQNATQVREDVIARPPGVATSSISFAVAAGNNYAIVAKAYREAAPLPADADPIAQGSATGLNVLASKRTSADISLVPLYVPSIDGLDVNAARIGGELTLTGTNLGMIGTATPAVYFGSIPSPRVTPVDATTLRAQVPEGATIGKVFVSNDGVMSQSQVLVYVLSGIALDAAREIWDEGPATGRQVRFGATLALQATPGWILASNETIDLYAPLPAAVWASSNPLGGTVDESGTVTAGRVNVATDVTATIGGVIGTMRVTPVGVARVDLDRTDLTLNAMPGGLLAAESDFATSATLSATVVTSFPFNSGVTWDSSDTALVTVAADGTLRTVRDAPKGTAIITAKSVDDPAIKATASVSVTIFGDLELGVD